MERLALNKTDRLLYIIIELLSIQLEKDGYKSEQVSILRNQALKIANEMSPELKAIIEKYKNES